MLTDGFVTLRPYEAADAGPLAEAGRESAQDVYPWLPWCHPDYATSDAQAWIARTAEVSAKGEHNFAIADAESGRLLGGCDLNRFDPELHWANLGYWVRSRSTGKGVATAAVRLLARYGFEKLDFNRVEIIVSVKNIASRRVA